MKIINKDNYDRETISDKLVCENVSEYYGEKITRILNDAEHRETSNFFKLVPDDYELFIFEP